MRKGNFQTFYRSEKDHQHFRKEIGTQLQNPWFAPLVVGKLRHYTDWINTFISTNATLLQFLSQKKEFVDSYRAFFAYHQAVYWGGDYLIEHNPELQETIKSLQEVYAYNERVVPNVEKYLCGLGIDHLTYTQEEGYFKEIGLLFFNNQDTAYLYSQELDDVESYILSLSASDTVGVRELKGISVSKGKVIGPVQVIKNPHLLYESKHDHIIVTGMTRPQFNHILSKSKGIIANVL